MGPKDAINDVPIPALAMGAGILCALMLCAMIVRKPAMRAGAMQKWGGVAGAWCAAIGYIVAHRRVVGEQFLPPNARMPSEHWIVYIALLGAIVATLKAHWRAPAWARWATRLLVAVLITGAMLIPLMRSYLEWFVWNSRDAGLWFVGGVAGVVWITTCLTMLSKRAPAWNVWMAMSAVLGAMAPSLAFWGVAQDARLMGVLSAMCGSVCVVCLLTKRKTFGEPIAIAMGAIAGALTLHAAANGEGLNYWSLALCMATPIAWIVADLPVFKRLNKWARYALRVILPAAVGGLAAWIAFVPDEYAGLGY